MPQRTFNLEETRVIQEPSTLVLEHQSQSGPAKASLKINLRLIHCDQMINKLAKKTGKPPITDPGTDRLDINLIISWKNISLGDDPEESLRVTRSIRDPHDLTEWLLQDWDDSIRQAIFGRLDAEDYYERGRAIRQVMKDLTVQTKYLRHRLENERKDREKLLQTAGGQP